MLVEALPEWVTQLTYYQIDPMVWISCQLGIFLYFGFTFSSSILLIISVEKCFALYLPFKSKTVCTVSIAKRVSLVTALIYAAFFSQMFYFAKGPSCWQGSYCNIFFPSYVYQKYFLTSIQLFIPMYHL